VIPDPTIDNLIFETTHGIPFFLFPQISQIDADLNYFIINKKIS